MNKKILIVTAQYYPEISKNLKKKAFAFLQTKIKKSGGKIDQIDVPGVFEIPVVISKNIKSYDAFVALGCVIKGKTSHFELITKSVSDGLMNLSIINKKPIGNGIIACSSKKQALERSSIKKVFKNKGYESARAIYELLKVFY